MMKIGLIVNAVFSSLTGLALMVFSDPLAARLGADRALLVALGTGLLGFAALVAVTARSEDPRRARGVVAADLGWIVAALPVAMIRPGGMTSTGSLALIAVTGVVAALAVVQWLGARSIEQR